MSEGCRKSSGGQRRSDEGRAVSGRKCDECLMEVVRKCQRSVGGVKSASCEKPSWRHTLGPVCAVSVSVAFVPVGFYLFAADTCFPKVQILKPNTQSHDTNT